MDLGQATEKQHGSVVELETNFFCEKRQQLQEQYTGNWVWRCVAALVDTDGFNPSPTWIASKLNTTIEEVVHALDGLEQLGIIRRNANGYEKVLKHIFYSDRNLDPIAVLTDHVLISTQILNQLDAENIRQASYYRTSFVATNKEVAQEYFRKLDALTKEFLIKSGEQSTNRVFALSLSGLDVSAHPPFSTQGDKE